LAKRGALFVPQPFQGRIVAPGDSIKVKEQEKMMRLDRAFGHMNRHIEKLRKKCLDFSDGIVQALSKRK
jgi:hypothetical protein